MEHTNLNKKNTCLHTPPPSPHGCESTLTQTQLQHVNKVEHMDIDKRQRDNDRVINENIFVMFCSVRFWFCSVLCGQVRSGEVRSCFCELLYVVPLLPRSPSFPLLSCFTLHRPHIQIEKKFSGQIPNRKNHPNYEFGLEYFPVAMVDLHKSPGHQEDLAKARARPTVLKAEAWHQAVGPGSQITGDTDTTTEHVNLDLHSDLPPSSRRVQSF